MAVLKYKNSQGEFVPIPFSPTQINVVLTTGQSTRDVMSQKSVTDIIEEISNNLLLSTPLTAISDPDTIGEFPNQRVFDAISILCPVEITQEQARSIFSNLNGTTKKVTIVYNGNLVLITSNTVTIDGIAYNFGDCTIEQQDDLYYIHASGPNT